jgi:ribonuclease HII
LERNTKPSLEYEHKFWEKNYSTVAGIDEAGRGALAGPLVVAGVVFSPRTSTEFDVQDSKKLSPHRRQQTFSLVCEQALNYAIIVVPPKDIDRLNVLQATLKGMSVALERLAKGTTVGLIDGNKVPDSPYLVTPIVSGDSISVSIAAASILAKVYRDHLISKYACLYPHWQLEKHKGYPTKFHKAQIHAYGTAPIHRTSFHCH